jgi:hypothetical protein
MWRGSSRVDWRTVRSAASIPARVFGVPRLIDPKVLAKLRSVAAAGKDSQAAADPAAFPEPQGRA